jgi:hypothetical protein
MAIQHSKRMWTPRQRRRPTHAIRLLNHALPFPPSATSRKSSNICSLCRHGTSPQSRNQTCLTHSGRQPRALPQQSEHPHIRLINCKITPKQRHLYSRRPLRHLRSQILLFEHTTHSTRNITFSLVVQDFGIKYTNRDDAIHLITALEDFFQSQQIGPAPFI